MLHIQHDYFINPLKQNEVLSCLSLGSWVYPLAGGFRVTNGYVTLL